MDENWALSSLEFSAVEWGTSDIVMSAKSNVESGLRPPQLNRVHEISSFWTAALGFGYESVYLRALHAGLQQEQITSEVQVLGVSSGRLPLLAQSPVRLSQRNGLQEGWHDPHPCCSVIPTSNTTVLGVRETLQAR